MSNRVRSYESWIKHLSEHYQIGDDRWKGRIWTAELTEFNSQEKSREKWSLRGNMGLNNRRKLRCSLMRRQ